MISTKKTAPAATLIHFFPVIFTAAAILFRRDVCPPEQTAGIVAEPLHLAYHPPATLTAVSGMYAPRAYGALVSAGAGGLDWRAGVQAYPRRRNRKCLRTLLPE